MPPSTATEDHTVEVDDTAPPETTAARPTLHFTAPSGWINDPLGLTFHGGRYHLFYQHVPGATDWAPQCQWGHATSDDLLSWSIEAAALEPGDGDGGCWSGSIALSPEGEATLFYTSVDDEAFDIGAARIARPAPGSESSWERWVKGPVVAELAEGEESIAFRDPFVFHDGARWRMLLGSGRPDGTAVAYGYVSDDLTTWHYDGVFASRHSDDADGVWTGSVWECPQLVRVGHKWALLVSVWEPVRPHYSAYALGQIVDGRFVAETPWRRLSYGPCYYAGAVFRDADGTPGMIYWLRGVADPRSEWVGAHSIPHQLALIGDRLEVRLPSSVESRRGSGRPLAALDEHGMRVDGAVDIDWAHGGSISLQEGLRNVFRLELTPTLDGVTLTATSDAGQWSVPSSGPLRVVIDGPIVEVVGSFGALAFPAPRSGTATLVSREAAGVAYPLH
ncbi:glycoside hydrolase family 32 protein [Galbitalea soli]|uniref:beta-fructofuranosidase n=1 Tax=Galbitalea soli TaxID=1268042 RepID=A0A7C9TQN1_9MICO|nr:glycoside hydrolase family 32 protein [Galbitalea soli]NEM91119.1 glycoside hydrolase family 32 protein [Galbitalea soli]NYJ29808.1 beta-fructofuranosidase [Galbitalea soli]